MMTLKEWQTTIHQLAKEKGWYDSPRTPLEIHMLIVSEVAEASEEVRKGNTPPIYQENYMTGQLRLIGPNDWDWVEGEKPEGELTELADAVIRILDYCEAKGWDLERAMEIKHGFNKTRPHRHGGKKL